MIYTIPDHILDELNLMAEEMRQQLTELLVEKRILTAEQAAEVVPVSPAELIIKPRPKPLTPPQVASLSERNRLGIQLMEEWLKTPDDKGAQWWDEFDQMVFEERKKFKFREIEL